MLEDFNKISEDMKELGLAALSHANRIEPETDKWAELSILQVAHAMEILIKARIAKEHPLLIFEKLPKPKKNPAGEIDDELTISTLAAEGRTIEWSSLLDTLWATNNIKTIRKEAFNQFGKIRNSIQHFGIPPADENVSYLTSLRFIYDVIDPFLKECWGMYAIDYCQDFDPDSEENDKFWEYIRLYLLRNEIAFSVSPQLYERKDFWWVALRVDNVDIHMPESFVEPIEISRKYYEAMCKELDSYKPA